MRPCIALPILAPAILLMPPIPVKAGPAPAAVWTGTTDGWTITWTPSDLVVCKGGNSQALLSPLVKRAFALFSSISTDGVDKDDPAANCDCQRTFSLLWVVGGLRRASSLGSSAKAPIRAKPLIDEGGSFALSQPRTDDALS